MPTESVEVTAFRTWLEVNGAYIHPNLKFVKDVSGMSVCADKEIPPDTKVASCPFSLAVTPELAKRVLAKISRSAHEVMDTFSERELICTYLAIHWILDDLQEENMAASAIDFTHFPYLNTFPPAEGMRTALQFNENELSLLKGTNLFGAIVDHHNERNLEWKRCQKFVSSIMPHWENLFTWHRYLMMSAYLSSRAFPSTLLSNTPSLITTPLSHPVLLPGVDAFNHSRAQRVSWVIDETPSRTPIDKAPLQVSLVTHAVTPMGSEVFNNYGPKPNAELILGYGFSLPSNPDDTILLKIGGQDRTSSTRWEVGRNARGAEGLWDELRGILREATGEEPPEWVLDMETAEMLEGMTESKLVHLPELPMTPPVGVRNDVFVMIQDYVLGQKEILLSLLDFAHEKRESSIKKARDEGVEFQFVEDITKG